MVFTPVLRQPLQVVWRTSACDHPLTTATGDKRVTGRVKPA